MSNTTMTDQHAEEFAAYVPNVHIDLSWVTAEGIGICGSCAYDKFLTERGHWNLRYNAVQAFGTIGMEPCDDEFCSICDRDTHA